MTYKRFDSVIISLPFGQADILGVVIEVGDPHHDVYVCALERHVTRKGGVTWSPGKKWWFQSDGSSKTVPITIRPLTVWDQLTRIAERHGYSVVKAAAAALDPDEKWRAALDAFYEARGTVQRASKPFDRSDKMNLAGLKAVLGVVVNDPATSAALKGGAA